MTYRFGLLGYPLTYSLSPQIHQVFLEECGLEGEYRLIPIAVNDETDANLKAVLTQMKNQAYHGLNVTIPYKQTVKDLLDCLDDKAQAVGAVNTIYRKGEALIGTNTDVEGFLLDLENKLSLEEGGNALVLGAGGAARAVIYGLLKRGWQVWIAARRLEQADELARHLAKHFFLIEGIKESIQIMAMSSLSDEASRSDKRMPVRLVINTTPLGTKGTEEDSPLPENLRFPKGTYFYDLVYNPSETAFMRQARDKGHKASNGFGMLIHQAALAFEYWTAKKITITPAIESKITARTLQNHG